ncbi:MAG: hypothetical protein M1591_06800 [Deltaproteobacteria bacterium]|nr:hypothetical protein [Deltaproteobacteria bacterium]MCL5276234.1 hypothetical protein [Deltaproteobacteria bacterium]
MKKVFAGICAIALTIASTGMVMAAEKENKQARQFQNKEQIQVIEKVSGLDAKTVGSLRGQHYGYGEIVIAGALAKASNQPLSGITALRKQGMGWGEIAQKYNLKLGEVMKSVHANINAYEDHAQQIKDKKGVDAANQVRNDVRNQEDMGMQNMMQHRNDQMQHEMNMNGHNHGDMNMNEQHGNGPDMNGMHGK